MPTPFFKVHSVSAKSKARRGTISTAHGTVETPAFVPVGTKGTIKALPQPFFKDIGIQLSFVNTYHLVTHPGVEVLRAAGGIHKLADYRIPLMSDSGGFQVFSLAQTAKRKAHVRGDEDPLVLKISEDGVKFRSVYDGATVEFSPETSMEFQRIIGADLMMAFDECTYYPATHEYTEKAMQRTHEWLKRCMEHRPDALRREVGGERQQFLYGIIQGGTYEDLRIASAKFIAGQDVPGVAIGGVSVGESKEEMREQVKWVAPYLPKDKPVHLLGVGHVDDIIDLVKHGIDTFDCVEPTRVARMGTVYQLGPMLAHLSGTYEGYEIDMQKSSYKADLGPLDAHCHCYVCQHYSKAYMHHLFKQREILGYTLASYHNLSVMEQLMREVRLLVEKDAL